MLASSVGTDEESKLLRRWNALVMMRLPSSVGIAEESLFELRRKYEAILDI